MRKLKGDIASPALLMLPAMLVLLQACSQGPITAPNIDKFGPQHVHAGAVFNKQPDGNSALWIRTTNRVAQGAVVLFNGQKLTSYSKDDVVTAKVPAALYAQPGSYSLQITEEVDGKQLQSNVVQFIVKP
jgi:hypothetical protein